MADITKAFTTDTDDLTKINTVQVANITNMFTRDYPAAAAVEYIYAMGGLSAAGYEDINQRYTYDTWTSMTVTPSPSRALFDGFTVGSSAFIIGGQYI